jgi:hypothetical protein
VPRANRHVAKLADEPPAALAADGRPFLRVKEADRLSLHGEIASPRLRTFPTDRRKDPRRKLTCAVRASHHPAWVFPRLSRKRSTALRTPHRPENIKGTKGHTALFDLLALFVTDSLQSAKSAIQISSTSPPKTTHQQQAQT